MFGRKMVLMGALIISIIAVAVEFIATTNAVFFIGKLLNGLMVGAVGTVMVSYIGEVGKLSVQFGAVLTPRSDLPPCPPWSVLLLCWRRLRYRSSSCLYHHQLHG